jgi:hypothetical protein
MPLTRPLRVRGMCIASSHTRLSARGQTRSLASAFVSASSPGPARSSSGRRQGRCGRRARGRQGSVIHIALCVVVIVAITGLGGRAQLSPRPQRTACWRLRDAARSAVRQILFTRSLCDASAGASMRSKPCPRGDDACSTRVSTAACVREIGARGTHASTSLPGGERASSGASSVLRARRTGRTASQQAPMPCTESGRTKQSIIAPTSAVPSSRYVSCIYSAPAAYVGE